MEGLNKSPKIKKVTAIPFALKEKVREGAVVPPHLGFMSILSDML